VTGITPFKLEISEAELDDLRRRLASARWPGREPVNDWSQGAPLGLVQELCTYWHDKYDWRRCERMLNDFGQYRTGIDGLGIHFLHVRSPHENAMPLLITHGWPGSVIEFHKIIGPLTDPTRYGGDAVDAFHLVAPSLPGFGFSDKPTSTGWNVERIARAWIVLMERLGYRDYVAQGGDWGSAVTSLIGEGAPPNCRAIHINLLTTRPNETDKTSLTDVEKGYLAAADHYNRWDSGYAAQQSTRPQTLSYGLVDSAVGQAAWIFEKYWAWSDCNGDPRTIFSFDEMLDNIMLYWLPGNAASSARLYWESFKGFRQGPVDIPTGCTIFPKEILGASRRWAERRYRNIIHWSEPAKGGHFAAFEQPEIFIEEIRTCFRKVR
jgi:pimeloyl-ACP methyl ester carboxylesterase